MKKNHPRFPLIRSVRSGDLAGARRASRRLGVLAATLFSLLFAMSFQPVFAAIITPTTAPATTAPSSGTTTTVFGPSGYPGTTSTTFVTSSSFGTVPPTVITTIATLVPTTIVGVATTTVNSSSTSIASTRKTNLIKLPTYYSAVTEEGAKVCNYTPNSTITTTLDGQPGPNLTTDSSGCISVAVTYWGNSQFTLNKSAKHTLSQGKNFVVLSGQGTSGGPLATTIQFKLAGSPRVGNASAIKGKGVPLLSLAIIAGLVLDALLFASGLALHMMSKRAKGSSELPLAGGNDDDEEEEGEFANDGFLGAPEPSSELPTPH